MQQLCVRPSSHLQTFMYATVVCQTFIPPPNIHVYNSCVSDLIPPPNIHVCNSCVSDLHPTSEHSFLKEWESIKLKMGWWSSGNKTTVLLFLLLLFYCFVLLLLIVVLCATPSWSLLMETTWWSDLYKSIQKHDSVIQDGMVTRSRHVYIICYYDS